MSETNTTDASRKCHVCKHTAVCRCGLGYCELNQPQHINAGFCNAISGNCSKLWTLVQPSCSIQLISFFNCSKTVREDEYSSPRWSLDFNKQEITAYTKS